MLLRAALQRAKMAAAARRGCYYVCRHDICSFFFFSLITRDAAFDAFRAAMLFTPHAAMPRLRAMLMFSFFHFSFSDFFVATPMKIVGINRRSDYFTPPLPCDAFHFEVCFAMPLMLLPRGYFRTSPYAMSACCAHAICCPHAVYSFATSLCHYA